MRCRRHGGRWCRAFYPQVLQGRKPGGRRIWPNFQEAAVNVEKNRIGDPSLQRDSEIGESAPTHLTACGKGTPTHKEQSRSHFETVSSNASSRADELSTLRQPIAKYFYSYASKLYVSVSKQSNTHPFLPLWFIRTR